jgi:hypothetical protein
LIAVADADDVAQ